MSKEQQEFNANPSENQKSKFSFKDVLRRIGLSRVNKVDTHKTTVSSPEERYVVKNIAGGNVILPESQLPELNKRIEVVNDILIEKGLDPDKTNFSNLSIEDILAIRKERNRRLNNTPLDNQKSS